MKRPKGKGINRNYAVSHTGVADEAFIAQLAKDKRFKEICIDGGFEVWRLERDCNVGALVYSTGEGPNGMAVWCSPNWEQSDEDPQNCRTHRRNMIHLEVDRGSGASHGGTYYAEFDGTALGWFKVMTEFFETFNIRPERL